MNSDKSQLPRELFTGVANLDQQHADLFATIQRIKAKLIENRGRYPNDTLEFTALRQAMAVHFAWEEAAASECNIPFESHAREHQRLLAMMDRELQTLEGGSTNLPALLVVFDRSFEMHVSRHDQTFGNKLRHCRESV